jgi:hypothetical protein
MARGSEHRGGASRSEPRPEADPQRAPRRPRVRWLAGAAVIALVATGLTVNGIAGSTEEATTAAEEPAVEVGTTDGNAGRLRPGTPSASPSQRAVPSEESPEPDPDASVDLSKGSLELSSNKRFLQHVNGDPFFYLGDTAWELFHRTTREEVDLLLEDRAQKGFTVIQTVGLSPVGGTTSKNSYGHLPLVDKDPSRPAVKRGAANDYWDHVDYVVEKAEQEGLYIGFLPAWGEYVDKAWTNADEILTTKNARDYGEFLGERYKDSPNIIWIAGGDRGPKAKHMPVWRELVKGLRAGDGGAHLVTYHPLGGHSSSSHMHEDPLFDFNTLQSGHCKSLSDAADMISKDYKKKPAKPTMDAEPRYEDHPKCHDEDKGYWDGTDVRHMAYVQTFAGAFGHTYGNHNIWQMYKSGRHPLTHARTSWRKALDHEGAGDMGHLRHLMESRPFTTRVPDQSLITSDDGSGNTVVRATRDASGSYALVYSSHGKSFSVDVSELSGSKIRAWWYDPRTGEVASSTTFTKPSGSKRFDPPGRPDRDNDWVLVLDDASQRFGAPGADQ